MITLGIGRMEIDWGKNLDFTNHSSLFRPSDMKPIPYYYLSPDVDEAITEMKDGYASKLSNVKRRLDLLGYNINSINLRYNDILREFGENGTKIQLSFDNFFDIISNLDVVEVDTVGLAVEFEENGYDFGEYVQKCVLQLPQFRDKMFAKHEESKEFINRWSKYDLAEFLEVLDPYILLRILAENPDNRDLEVRWSFADVIENGWIQQNENAKLLEPERRILIVTEGSSDTFIFHKAINELYPEIADFFYFVDMKENYPFTGTGNLYNFCMGLSRIRIQNNIIVIFDNDTAGIEKYNNSMSLRKPDTFLIMKLPNLTEFTKFNTIGPNGKSHEDINGKAVAIECFLDFKSIQEEPCIRWTSYNKNLNKYQGELIRKDHYINAFKEYRLIDGGYDTSKLKHLIDHIITLWISRNEQ